MRPGFKRPDLYRDWGRIHALAEVALQRVWGHLLQKEKEGRLCGGYFTACYLSDPSERTLGEKLGVLDQSRAERYRFNAFEKVNRLAGRMRWAVVPWCSTFEDADEKAMPPRFGGGVGADNFATGFSGLPPHGDEVICIQVELWLGIIDLQIANLIAKHSDNLLFFRMLGAGAITETPPVIVA